MSIPVFHDDQHGTAIIVGAAVRNGLELAGKNHRNRQDRRLRRGRGGAGLPRACWWRWARRRENIFVTDLEGVVYKGRNKLMDPLKETFAQETSARTLAEVIPGADVFLGLSAGGVLKQDMVRTMAATPLILALANPHPEIMPEDALAVRPDAMLCTGRSDYPNQVNNVLCFPYIFRGALDVHATTINEAMKLAAVERHRRTGARGPVGSRGARLWRRRAALRQEFADPLALRSAPDPAHRSRRGAGGDGQRRGAKNRSRISTPIRKSWSARCSAPASS